MLTDLPAARTWTNWVGNQSFTPGHSAAPRDEQEVATLVRDVIDLGAGVRVAAAGHSFTPVVATDGLLLDLSAMSGVVATDRERKRATALAGTPIHGFYEPLWAEGLALKNQGDIDTQQIAGAVATATHGSGIRNTCFSGVVRGVRLVTGTGEIREITEREPELLRAAQVSIGMLGVMTQLELEVTDAYRLSEQVEPVALAGGARAWDELVHEHRHFGFFWLPTEESAALYNLHGDGQTMADKCYVKIYDEPADDQPDDDTPGRRTDRCYRIYPMVYDPNFHELEYFVPLDRGPDALAAMRELMLRACRTRCSRWRSARSGADDAYLSPNYGTATTVISVSGEAGHRLLGLPAVGRLAARRLRRACPLGQAALPHARAASTAVSRSRRVHQDPARARPEGVFLNDHLRPLFA